MIPQETQCDRGIVTVSRQGGYFGRVSKQVRCVV